MCPIGSVFFTLRKWAAAQQFKLTLDCVRLAPFFESKRRSIAGYVIEFAFKKTLSIGYKSKCHNF